MSSLWVPEPLSGDSPTVKTGLYGQVIRGGWNTDFVIEAVSGEGTPDTAAEGTGYLSAAADGTKVRVLELDTGESLSVNVDDVLASEPSLEYEINTVSSISGTPAGGLTNVSLTGAG